jgi:hypothetical protein
VLEFAAREAEPFVADVRTRKNSAWVLVARNILHLENAKARYVGWWCVPGTAIPGDRGLLYKPREGIVLYFEVLALRPPQLGFCHSFGLATADVKILKTFGHPITINDLKHSDVLRQMTFVRRSCQGKVFPIGDEAIKAILDIPKQKAKRAAT